MDLEIDSKRYKRVWVDTYSQLALLVYQKCGYKAAYLVRYGTGTERMLGIKNPLEIILRDVRGVHRIKKMHSLIFGVKKISHDLLKVIGNDEWSRLLEMVSGYNVNWFAVESRIKSIII